MVKKLLLGFALCVVLAANAHSQPLNPTPAAVTQYASEKAAVTALITAEKDRSLRATKWTYVGVSGGILDTTSTPMKAAAGAGKKIYIASCQMSNSGTGAGGTEVIFYSGTSASPVWRGWIGTLQERQVTFSQPVETAANALAGVVLSSATNVAVRINCQGWTD